MTDTPRRPGESPEECAERVRCLNSASTRYALQHREQLADTSDDDNEPESVGYKFMCRGADDD